MSLAKLKKGCLQQIQSKQYTETLIPEVDINFWANKSVFCRYQREWITDESPIAVIEKSRQIGCSYAFAFRAVYKAVANLKDTVVNSYNKDAVKNFLKDCAIWSRIFNEVFQLISYQEIINNQNINIFEIRFLNGRTITGLPGKAVSFRSHAGKDAVLDEVAYQETSIEDLLAASSAQLIHGGTVRLISTHAGVDSDFNLLCNRIKKGELPYKLHTTTFKDALRQGLYKRICAKNGEEWSKEKQKAWRKEIYDFYGIRAEEELNCVPGDYSNEGRLFNKFLKISTTEIDKEPWNYPYARYHDLATSLEDTAFYSASIKVAYNFESRTIIIVDWFAAHLSPLEGDAQIIASAQADGVDCAQVIEEENQSSGRKYVEIMRSRLAQMGHYNVHNYHPTLSKLQRLIPVANAAQSGRVMIAEELHNREEFERTLRRVSMKKVPLVSDLGDCLSGLFDFLMNGFVTSMLDT
jgi:hypothetical protein